MSETEPNMQQQQAVCIEGAATRQDLQQIGVETRNALLVVAALIMTATYQAALQPPGGLWQDDGNDHTAGRAVMGKKSQSTYVMFLFFNSMGFFGSYIVIWSLLEGFPMKKELRLALLALICTYDISMAALTSNEIINWIFVGISILMPLLFPMIVRLVDCVGGKLRRK